MNDTHRACIANNLIDSLAILVSGDVKFQTIYVPQGSGLPTKVRRRIIIEHDIDDE